jgi:hypothetical protein
MAPSHLGELSGRLGVEYLEHFGADTADLELFGDDLDAATSDFIGPTPAASLQPAAKGDLLAFGQTRHDLAEFAPCNDYVEWICQAWQVRARTAQVRAQAEKSPKTLPSHSNYEVAGLRSSICSCSTMTSTARRFEPSSACHVRVCKWPSI